MWTNNNIARGVFKSVLACICTGALCTASVLATDAPVDLTRALALTVSGVGGKLTPDAQVAVLTNDGRMKLAESVGQDYFIKNVGVKVLITVTHPQFGTATIETTMPMVDPAYANIVFTGWNRAYLEMAQRAPVLSDLIAQAASGGCVGGGIGDECGDPIAIGDGVWAGTTADNTGSTGDDTTCTFNDTIDEWYCYTATCTGTATASFCSGGGSATYDTSLAVFSACGGAQLACNDDTCGLQSEVSWAVNSGDSYLIRVSGFNDAFGSFLLAVSCVGGGGDPGDECDTCFPIGEGVFAGTTCDNTGAVDDTSCAGGDTIDEWYCYTPSCDGTATAATCGSGFDTTLAVFSSCVAGQLACNDDSCGLQSEVSWAVTGGVTYYIRVSGFGGQCGSYTLDVSVNCGCQSDADCPAGEVCINGNCVPPPCTLECPAGALQEGEACGTDTNGGCNSSPPAFTDAVCGDTFCGTAWADGGTRDTDWYSVEHGGGIISATLISQFPGVCFILSGVGPDGNPCNAVLEGTIGCSDDCNPIADATANLPAGHYVVFVALGDCAGGGIFEGFPCGGGNNDYTLSISCTVPVFGACCLEDGTCVDGVTPEECEAAPSPGCGDCDMPGQGPGCSDPTCEAIVCNVDPFCCAVVWDSICAGEAEDLCDCGVGGLGGVYQGDDTVCPGPLCIPVGGCCQCDGVEQFCTLETEEDCAALGGVYLGDDAACEFIGEQLVVSSNPNVSIPDAFPPGVDDSIVVGESFSIVDLEVQIKIDHTWIGDLCVSLSKDGSPFELLMSRIGADTGGNACHSGGPFGCADNNLDVVLDDEAASSIEGQCAGNLAGTYRPDPGSLAGFLGGDAAGTWTLNVVDNAGGDLGTFVSWSLIITQPPSEGTPCGDAFPLQCLIVGSLDIKPGSCPNPLNRTSRGVLPVALVGIPELNAADVDLSTLEISRADGVGGFVAALGGRPGPTRNLEDVATPFEGELCDCHDATGDGVLDVQMKFDVQEMRSVLELDSVAKRTLLELCVTGILNDGTGFIACDCVRIQGRAAVR